MTIWAAQWRSKNQLDGITKHIINDNRLPALFKTREECRKFIEARYGYIAEREDLQEEPHGWMMPKPVKVKIEYILPNKEGYDKDN
jgi:hypothetical protein